MHSRPRKSLFIPTVTKDGPKVNDLDRHRVIDIRFCDDDKTETVRDQWMSSGGRSGSFKKRWTGCSIFQIKVPGKHPAEVQVVGGSDDEDKRSTCSSENRLVLDNSACVEAPTGADSSDDGSSCVGGQPHQAGGCDAWLPMNEYDLVSIRNAVYEEDSRREVTIEDQESWAVACACSSCQVETATKRCQHED